MEAVQMTNQMSRKACRARARSIRREQARLRNEPPVLTVGEEVFNAASHGLGALLAVAAMVLLLVRSHTGLEIMASCFYGISMVLMMCMSGIYHALPSGSATLFTPPKPGLPRRAIMPRAASVSSSKRFTSSRSVEGMSFRARSFAASLTAWRSS